MNKRVVHKNIPVISLENTIQEALQILRELRVEGLPVVHDNKLLGIILTSDIEYHLQKGKTSPENKVQTLELENPIYARLDIHAYEILKNFDNVPYCFLPVIDSKDNYIGVVYKEDLVDELSDIFRVLEEGTVFEFEVPIEHFRLSEMIKVIEQNDAQVLSMTSRPSKTNASAQIVTCKLQTQEPFRLQNTLEKLGYPVSYSSASTVNFLDDTSFKAQEFMKYLEI
jgi:acetoin utilization protein AcuB